MNKKPVIGILASRFSTDFNSCGRHFVNDTYVASVARNGALPFMIPICDDEKDCDTYLEMCDAVMFPGGHDVHPLLYGEDPLPLQGESSLRYDRYQLYMAKKAVEMHLPMLGICRGIQLMNVAAGGTLYQDVSYQKMGNLQMHEMSEKDHGQVCHSVNIEEGSRLYGMFGKKVLVNSYHHQAVKALGEGYRVTAHANDGTIEAIERDGDVFCVGVQWHPEAMFEAYEDMRPLFAEFVKAAEAYAKNRKD